MSIDLVCNTIVRQSCVDTTHSDDSDDSHYQCLAQHTCHRGFTTISEYICKSSWNPNGGHEYSCWLVNNIHCMEMSTVAPL